MNHTPDPSLTICICGAGTMGAGIAQVTTQHRFKTILYDSNTTALEKGRSSIKKNLNALVEKNKLTAHEHSDICGFFRFTNSIEDCKADIIIEAVIEELAVKRELFNQLAKINNEHTVLATNTSSLSVSSIADGLPHPGRIAGMHFFNPPALMKLVEIVKGEATSNESIEKLMLLAKQLGKTPVRCKDLPGFIVNRVARPYYLEALRMLEQGIAELETIDKVMEGTGFKMGPFRLMDLIGNDINLAVTVSLYKAFNCPERFTPSPIQEKKVANGELGRKTKKGYYNY